MGIIRDNPVLRRECNDFVPRSARRARGWRRIWFVHLPCASLLGGAICLFLKTLHSPDPTTVVAVAVMIWGAFTAIASCAHTSRSIVQERLQGTWDGLLVTPLRPAEIVMGKLLGPLIPCWAIGALLLPASVVAVVRTPPPLQVSTWYDTSLAVWVVLVAYLAATVGSLLLASVGLYASMRCASAWAALMWTFVPMAMVWYGVVLFGCYALPAMLLRFDYVEWLGRREEH